MQDHLPLRTPKPNHTHLILGAGFLVILTGSLLALSSNLTKRNIPQQNDLPPTSQRMHPSSSHSAKPVRNVTQATGQWVKCAFPSRICAGLAIGNDTPSTIYARDEASGIWKSQEGVFDWQDINKGQIPMANTNGIAVDPNNPAVVYVVGNAPNGVYKTTNAGSNWAKVYGTSTTPLMSGISINPQNTMIIYAGIKDGVAKSVDGGISWSEIMPKIFPPQQAGWTSLLLAIDPINTQTVYVKDGLYAVIKTTDGGNSWKSLTLGGAGTIYSLAIDKRNPNILYAAQGPPAKSIDGGISIASLQIDPDNRVIYTIVIDPNNSSTIYAGGISGVFRSTDAGATWSSYNDGLSGITIYNLTFNQSGSALYAGTSNGLYSVSIPVTSCQSPSIVTPPSSQSILTGQTATLSVVASGTMPFSYQWYEGLKGDISKPVGGNANTFTTPALTTNKSYWVRVSNPCNNADSEAAFIQIGQAIVDLMVKVTADVVSVKLGNTMTFTVYVKNNGKDLAKGSILKTNFLDAKLEEIPSGQEIIKVLPPVIPPKLGNFTFLVQAIPQETEANPSDNTSSTSIMVTLAKPNDLLPGRLFSWKNRPISPNKPTIIFTHGLSNISDSPDDLWTGGSNKTPNQAMWLIANTFSSNDGQEYNILQYVWDGAFQVGLPPPIRSEYVRANSFVPLAGKILAKLLLNALSEDYDNRVLFVGHSLGTAVNTYAATDFLAKATKISSAQLSYLDRPHHVNKIPEASENIVGCKAAPLDSDTFEITNGYDSTRYLALLRNVGTSPSRPLILDNYYTKSGCAGVGDFLAINKPIITTAKYKIYNYELISPNDVGGKYFSNENTLTIDNDHSGVQQWFRLTISPNHFDQKICNGGYNPPLGWSTSLNPCGPQGWKSTNITSMMQGASALSETFKFGRLPDTLIDNSSFEDISVRLSGFTGQDGCTLNSDSTITCQTVSGSVTSTIVIPPNTQYLSFQYRFNNAQNGDYLGAYIDGNLQWQMYAYDITENTFIDSGPIAVSALTGERTVTLSWYRAGTKSSSVEIKNFLLTKPSTEPEKYEADTSPRPDGNKDGTVSVADWVQIGRFTVGLDVPEVGSEFQRVDCAPRGTLGDGKITIADWVQAGRYTAGLDPVVSSGGPTAPSIATALNAPSASLKQNIANSLDIGGIHLEAASMIRAVATSFQRGQIGVMKVELDAQGDENGMAFSLNFDPQRIAFVDAKVSDGVIGAALYVNSSQVFSGKIGIALALPAGQRFAARTHALLNIRFIPIGGESDEVTRISFDNQLIPCEMVDVKASVIANVTYESAFYKITGRAVAMVSAASFNSGEMAADSIVSAFGGQLAITTQSTTSLPLPISLGGTSVIIKDSKGIERFAPLFYVSPTQINLQIPKEIAEGIATVIVFSPTSTITGVLNIGKIAPALFTVNSSGAGYAAGSVLHVRDDGLRYEKPIASYDTGLQKFIANQIDLSMKSEQVFLTLYGTGIRNRSDLASVKVKIGSADVQVTYAGSQGHFSGLDQVNVLIPHTLSGKGETLIQLVADGKFSNIAKINIK